VFLTVFVIVLACMFFGVGRIFEVLFTLLCALVVTCVIFSAFWFGLILLFA
jgi:hypothetical protein